MSTLSRFHSESSFQVQVWNGNKCKSSACGLCFLGPSQTWQFLRWCKPANTAASHSFPLLQKKYQYGIFGRESQTSLSRNAKQAESDERRLYSQATLVHCRRFSKSTSPCFLSSWHVQLHEAVNGIEIHAIYTQMKPYTNFNEYLQP